MFPERLNDVHEASKHVQANVALEVIAHHFKYLPHPFLEVALPLQLDQVVIEVAVALGGVIQGVNVIVRFDVHDLHRGDRDVPPSHRLVTHRQGQETDAHERRRLHIYPGSRLQGGRRRARDQERQTLTQVPPTIYLRASMGQFRYQPHHLQPDQHQWMPREPQHRDANLVVPGEYEVARVPKELGHDQQRAVGADGRRRHVGRGRGGIAVVPRVDDVTQPVGRVGVQSAQGRGHHAALLPLHEYPEALRQGVGGACAHDRLRIAQRNEDVVEEVVGASGAGGDAAQALVGVLVLVQ